MKSACSQHRRFFPIRPPAPHLRLRLRPPRRQKGETALHIAAVDPSCFPGMVELLLRGAAVDAPRAKPVR